MSAATPVVVTNGSSSSNGNSVEQGNHTVLAPDSPDPDVIPATQDVYDEGDNDGYDEAGDDHEDEVVPETQPVEVSEPLRALKAGGIFGTSAPIPVSKTTVTVRRQSESADDRLNGSAVKAQNKADDDDAGEKLSDSHQQIDNVSAAKSERAGHVDQSASSEDSEVFFNLQLSASQATQPPADESTNSLSASDHPMDEAGDDGHDNETGQEEDEADTSEKGEQPPQLEEEGSNGAHDSSRPNAEAGEKNKSAGDLITFDDDDGGEKQLEIDEDEDEPSSAKSTPRTGGRKLSKKQQAKKMWEARRAKQQQAGDSPAQEQQEEAMDESTHVPSVEEEETTEASPEAPPKKMTRRSRGAAATPNPRTPVQDLSGKVEPRSLRDRSARRPPEPSKPASATKAKRATDTPTGGSTRGGRQKRKSSRPEVSDDDAGRSSSEASEDRKAVDDAAKTPKSARGRRRSAAVVRATTPEPVVAATKRQHLARGAQSEGRPSARGGRGRGRGRGRGGAGRGRRSMNEVRVVLDDDEDDDDPYSLSHIDQHPEPLHNIQVNRGAFGSVKFTKPSATEDGANISRYEKTEKAAIDRRSTLGDTLPVRTSDDEESSSLTDSYRPIYRVTTYEQTVIEKLSPNTFSVVKSVISPSKRKSEATLSQLSPALRKQISPNKSTPSSGNLADVSSLGSKSLSGGDGDSHPRSTPSSRVSSMTKTRTPASSAQVSSASLFSDIEERMADREGDDIPDEQQDERQDDAMDDEDVYDRPDGSETGDDHTPAKTPRRKTPKTTPKSAPPKSASKATPSSESTASSRKRRTQATDEGVLPKRMSLPVIVPELTPDEQLHADHPDNHAGLVAGSRVLARWTDKNFYPGHVVSRDGLGRYKVKYIDETVRDMPAPDVVPLAMVVPPRTCMFAVDEEELQPVEILKCPSADDANDWFAGKFLVMNKTTEKQATVHWIKFVIDADQTKEFAIPRFNTAARDVVADNINLSDDRRSRQTRPKSFSPAVTTPRAARQSETPKKRQPKTPLARVAASDDHMEERSSSRENEPAPVMPIFEDLRFILTSANRKSKVDMEENKIVPFNKREVRQIIENRGGKVVDDFSALPTCEGVFLVADTHYRTHKYLSALARAVPCVNHQWIHSCMEKEERLAHEDFMLAAGVSLETERLIDWHGKGPKLLKDMVVLVHTENRPQQPTALDFVQIWAPLVRCMGATVVDKMPTDKLDVLLTDASCRAEVLDQAKALNAIAVSSEWLIQAIIMGECPALDGHERYRYDYTEQMGD